MNVLELTPPITLSATNADLPSGFVVVDPKHVDAFESMHRHEARLHKGRGEFGRELPNQGDAQLAALNERGIANVGAAVDTGMILIGVGEDTYHKPTPEELLLRAIFGEKAGSVIVTTEKVPAGAAGIVVESEIVGDEARVVVERRRPLEIGDLLNVDGAVAVVAGLEACGGIAGKGLTGEVEVFKVGSARETLASRGSGPYDDISAMPVEFPEDRHGQRSSLEWLRTLAKLSPWAAWELIAVHGTQNLGSRAFTDLMQGKPPSPPADVSDKFSFFEAPKPRNGLSIVLDKMLEALGLVVDFDADEIWAGAREDDEIRAHSMGQVKSTQLIYGSGDDVVDGLWSQKIFGPRRDYQCACGKYAGMKHTGMVCEECGVIIGQRSMRITSMGHIELSQPCASPLFDGVEMQVIPVLPPLLRDAAVDRLYIAVLEANEAGAGVAEAVEDLMVGSEDSLAARCDELWTRDFVTRTLDFSGVAHVTVCDVEPGKCRLPVEMARELFRAHVFGELSKLEIGVKEARRLIDEGAPAALEAFERAVAGPLVLIESGDNVLVRRAEVWDQPSLGVDTASLSELPEVAAVVHLPVMRESLFELTQGRSLDIATDGVVPVPAPSAEPRGGWLSDAICEESIVEAVCGAVVGELRDPAEHPLLRAALGKKLAPPPAHAFDAFCAELEAQQAARRPTLSKDPNLELTLPEAEFPVSVMEKLQALGFETVGDVCKRSDADILKTQKFGRRDLAAIKDTLAELGLELRRG